MAKQRLYREELYELMWSEAASEVASRYQVTESTIIAYCREMRVPFPSESYWNALRQGKKMKRAPLPDPGPNQVGSVATPLDRDPSAKRSIGERLQEAIDGAPAEDVAPIFVLPDAYEWHRLVVPIRARLERSAAQAREGKKRHEWQEAHPGRQYPSKTILSLFGSWTYFMDRGGILETDWKKPVIRATLTTYERALYIASEVCRRSEERGFSVSSDQERSRIELHRDKASVAIRVMEKMRSEMRKRAGFDSLDRVLHSTGKLELCISRGWHTGTCIPHHPRNSFDEQWPKIIDSIEKHHARSLVEASRRAEREIVYKEEARLRQEEALRQQRLKDEAEAERKRRDQLLWEAEQWDRVDKLRRFLAELDSRRTAGGTPERDYESWRLWAENAANEMDSKRVERSRKPQ